MRKKFLKIKTSFIASLPSNLRNKFDIETCYSAAYSSSLKKIVFPSTSTGEIFIFSLYQDLKVKKINVINLGKNVKPDIAIFKEKKIIVGCRDTFSPIIINENFEVKPLFKPDTIIYPTCFKISKLGRLFVGNLYGEPYIVSEDKIVRLPIKCSQTYDCLWLSEQRLLVSSTWENRVIYLKEIKKKWTVINTFQIIQPYRFSPILNDNVLLTSRGWLDRPGKVHHLSISKFNKFDNKTYIPKTMPGLQKSIEIPDKMFFLKKYLPSKILSFFNFKKYTGYINDVAWIKKDHFIVTTKHGGSLIVFDLEGKIKGYNSRLFPSELTRFIDSRNPSSSHLFVDAYRSSIFKSNIKY